jgi:hypothetical protein
MTQRRFPPPWTVERLPGGFSRIRWTCGSSLDGSGERGGTCRCHLPRIADSHTRDLTGSVVAPRWDLAGYAALHLDGHAVWLMKRRRRYGLGGSCDGQNKSNSDQPDHCHLHMNLLAEGGPVPSAGTAASDAHVSTVAQLMLSLSHASSSAVLLHPSTNPTYSDAGLLGRGWHQSLVPAQCCFDTSRVRRIHAT